MSSSTTQTQRFLFLEFLDTEIRNLLTSLRRIFGDTTDSVVHVTVRGPYPGVVSEALIRSLEKQINEEPLLIHGVGMFENPDENVVFIRVKSSALKRIWWKPDYPVAAFGFNPHVSLHRGADCLLATRIRDFLCKEDIALLCQSSRLVSFTSRQQELFPAHVEPQEYSFPTLVRRGLVKSDILSRALEVMERHGADGRCVQSVQRG